MKAPFNPILALLLAALAHGGAAAAPSDQACAGRVNDTPDKLMECIQAPLLWNHLVQFQRIADENPGSLGHGNRDLGTPGYKASVDYVAGIMRKAGYQVTIQKYQYRTTEVASEPQVTLGEARLAQGQDWTVARNTGAGQVHAAIAPVRGGGCAAADFAGFVRGRVALLTRAPCGADRQVANAQAAGAAAVLIANDDHAGGALESRLIEPARIPVIGMLTKALGDQLLRQHEAGTAPLAHIDVRTKAKKGWDYNVIADAPLGDPNRVVIVDAHLDSIYGAGILDNASGSGTIIEVARMLARTPTRNQLRYVWFGGEEKGLLGSKYYTRHLTDAERARIVFDIDVDVTSTPNHDYLIADPGRAPNVDKFPPNVVPESEPGNQAFRDYFARVGVPVQSAKFGNQGTDSNAFSLIGVPNSGILTQQNCCKKGWEVAIWGGVTGNYEGKIPSNDGGCVDMPKRWCDNLSNNNAQVLEQASRAAAYAIQAMANHVFAKE